MDELHADHYYVNSRIWMGKGVTYICLQKLKPGGITLHPVITII